VDSGQWSVVSGKNRDGSYELSDPRVVQGDGCAALYSDPPLASGLVINMLPAQVAHFLLRVCNCPGVQHFEHTLATHIVPHKFMLRPTQSGSMLQINQP